MKIAVLGTGMVGATIGTKLIELGHEVMMGSRDAGNEKALTWVQISGDKASEGTFAEAAAFGEIIFNCTNGMGSINALSLAGEINLEGKLLMDVSNPLDFSKGMPPSLSVCNTDSLGEQIQRTFLGAKVVKTLNTVNCKLMVAPELVPGMHNIFICGNDADAKAKATLILKSFGWSDDSIMDLGDISGARTVEMLLPVWVRLMGKFQSSMFNFHIVKG